MDYQTEYINLYPSLHSEDAALKFQDLSRALKLLPSCQSILDVGCGAGNLLIKIKEFLNARNALGIDFSKSGIDVARKQNNSRGIEWQCVDVFKLPSKQNWDLIVLADVLEHIEQDTELLKFLLDIGEFIIIRVPIEDNLINRAIRHFSNFDPWEDSLKRYGHVHHYSVEKLKHLIKIVDCNLLDISLYPLRKRSFFWFEIIRLALYPLFWMAPNLSVKVTGGFAVLLLNHSTFSNGERQ